MNCVLKTELTTEINQIQGALERLDAFFKERHTLEVGMASESFLSAWNRVKTARQTMLSINLESEENL